ncbi:oxygenase [Lithospermum erythrorhizon]|uniref:Oxygenase n=1 Tax=Lithospermum erythrorhizon TaxID=34254 RepID=A0AAV3PPG1_LITER
MSYSAGERRHSPYATTAAPPPTPSTQPTQTSNSDEATVALLSSLLHRLPPSLSLSLPSRFGASSSTTSDVNESGSSEYNITRSNKQFIESDNYSVVSSTTMTIVSPPSISLDELSSSLLSYTQLGFFQLTNHSIPSELASSAESNALSLFDLPQNNKTMFFPQNWPFGYDENQEFESFILDSNCSTKSTEIDLVHLKHFTKKMEELGLEVLEGLVNAIGFKNPVDSDLSRVCSQMWISNSICNNNNKEDYSGRVYPYVIGLHYQIRRQHYSMLTESGRVYVSPLVESVLVTLGDITQVWSNGKLKKIRGWPTPIVGDNYNIVGSQLITMSLLITLPVSSMVSPLRTSKLNNIEPSINNHENILSSKNSQEEEKVEDDKWEFNTFHFEDYAWRVFHERILDKDPLDRYRV